VVVGEEAGVVGGDDEVRVPAAAAWGVGVLEVLPADPDQGVQADLGRGAGVPGDQG
jgi:hypothetical protein